MSEIRCGDALTLLKDIPSKSVQCCVTSPPYYGLRDYGIDGQIGLEDTPEAYIAKLVEVFREVRRVLRPGGTLWVNIGDSYAGGRIGRDDSGDNGAFRGPRIESTCRSIPADLKPKDLIGIPWMFAFALRADGWYLRSDIIWHKPTAMPESVTDRPTSAHEHIFLLAKSERYFYDADAIREPLRPKTFTTYGSRNTAGKGNDGLGNVKSDNWNRTVPEKKPRLSADGEIAGANKRNVWTIASKPYPGSHFATFPPKLIEPCILAGTSPRACEHCGAAWERVTAREPMVIRNGPKAGGYGSRTTDGLSGTMVSPARVDTLGWQPTCTCKQNGEGHCIVLDPFMGAGTVALVAIKYHRDYLGIEINPEYVRLAQERIATVQPVLWEVPA